MAFNLENISDMTESNRKIADFVMKNKSLIPYMSTESIAEELGISVATISRFWKDIGYTGFKEVKKKLIEDLHITPASKMQDLLIKVSHQDYVSELISRQIAYLENTEENLDREQLEKAVSALIHARHVYIFGPGPAESLAQMLHFRLNRFDMPVFVMPKSGREIYEVLMNATSDDVVVVFGFLRPLPETKVILQYAKTAGYKIILITDLLVSEMREMSDIVLYVCRGESSEFHSMVGPMVLIDCLVIAIVRTDEKKYLDKLQNLYQLRKEFINIIPR